MVSVGDEAPDFALPGLVDGDLTTVSLSDYRGDVVILAFYPGDFNPACDEDSTDLDQLDLFTMQKDVTILGISRDSVFSHVAFADTYDLAIPLLSDTAGDVLWAYDMAFTDDMDQHLAKRGVVVLDHNGVIQYRWETEDFRTLPPVERIREAIEDIGGDDTALARYRVGHAHYVEGKRAFTSAMGTFENSEWMMAQTDFTRAYDEFQEAAEHFDTAERFADDDEASTYYQRATRKATSLWQAAEWMADSANAFASGQGADGDQFRRDAEAPLEEARSIHEPVAPDEFPPEEDPADLAEPDDDSILPGDEPEAEPSLEVDLDEAAAEPSGDAAETARAMGDASGSTDDPEISVADEGNNRGGETGEVAETGGHAEAGGPTDAEPAAPGGATDAGDSAEAAETGGGPSTQAESEAESEIDDAELEEITAELEQQTENAQDRYEREAAADEAEAEDADDEPTDLDEDLEDWGMPTDEESSDQGRSDRSEADADTVEDDLSEDDLDLDLADPTEGEPVSPDDAADLSNAVDDDADAETAESAESADSDDPVDSNDSADSDDPADAAGQE
jgi:peroxiredoxin